MAETPKHHRQKELLAYAQGFLGPQEQTELEEHLKHCADCQKTLEEVRQFLPALQQALTPNEPSTAEMLARVREQMRNRPPVKAKAPFFTWARVGLTAGGLALAASVLIVLQPLLRQAGNGGIAAGQQHQPGRLSSPHRPGWVPDEEQDAGPDAGMDAGAEDIGGGQ